MSLAFEKNYFLLVALVNSFNTGWTASRINPVQNPGFEQNSKPLYPSLKATTSNSLTIHLPFSIVLLF